MVTRSSARAFSRAAKLIGQKKIHEMCDGARDIATTNARDTMMHQRTSCQREVHSRGERARELIHEISIETSARSSIQSCLQPRRPKRVLSSPAVLAQRASRAPLQPCKREGEALFLNDAITTRARRSTVGRSGH